MSVTFHKLADRSGVKKPDGSWPLAGVLFQRDPPKGFGIPAKIIETGKREGWIKTEGDQVETYPDGPPEDLLRKVFTFVHYDKVIFHMVDKTYKCRVVRNPHKDANGSVRHDYVLERLN